MVIDCLVEKGYLKPERRQDHAAIQSAIGDFICQPSGLSKVKQPDLRLVIIAEHGRVTRHGTVTCHGCVRTVTSGGVGSP
jgi:hypothetical protein